ncbi:protein of unknown function [Magnetospira sp. QH-2]|nr:protein of unknown function [Magnetospira sp. QH-2]
MVFQGGHRPPAIGLEILQPYPGRIGRAEAGRPDGDGQESRLIGADLSAKDPLGHGVRQRRSGPKPGRVTCQARSLHE